MTTNEIKIRRSNKTVGGFDSYIPKVGKTMINHETGNTGRVIEVRPFNGGFEISLAVGEPLGYVLPLGALLEAASRNQ